MISKDTATDIALAYREIETAQKLLDVIVDALKANSMPDIRDGFGRPQSGLQLGVPSGDTCHRLFNVPWTLAKVVIEAHIAHHELVLFGLNEKAQREALAGQP